MDKVSTTLTFSGPLQKIHSIIHSVVWGEGNIWLAR